MDAVAVPPAIIGSCINVGCLQAGVCVNGPVADEVEQAQILNDLARSCITMLFGRQTKITLAVDRDDNGAITGARCKVFGDANVIGTGVSVQMCGGKK